LLIIEYRQQNIFVWRLVYCSCSIESDVCWCSQRKQ